MSENKNLINRLTTSTGIKLGNGGKIAISWAVVVAGGLYAFYLSRTFVVEKRIEHMKIRERMYASNSGEYEPSSRYTKHD